MTFFDFFRRSSAEADERLRQYTMFHDRLIAILVEANYPQIDTSLQAGMDLFLKAALDLGLKPEDILKGIEYEIEVWKKEQK